MYHNKENISICYIAENYFPTARALIGHMTINQSFILTRYVEELKNSFEIRTCTKIFNNYGYIIISFNFKKNSINCKSLVIET